MTRNRVIYFLFIVSTICIGLLSRTEIVALWLTSNFGDYLYSVLIFLIFGWIFKSTKPIKILIITLLFCYGIELLQLYQPKEYNWIRLIRDYKFSKLILGNNFSWNDILYYTFGSMTVYFLETRIC